jgi:hypothetical protein
MSPSVSSESGLDRSISSYSLSALYKVPMYRIQLLTPDSHSPINCRLSFRYGVKPIKLHKNPCSGLPNKDRLGLIVSESAPATWNFWRISTINFNGPGSGSRGSTLRRLNSVSTDSCSVYDYRDGPVRDFFVISISRRGECSFGGHFLSIA